VKPVSDIMCDWTVLDKNIQYYCTLYSALFALINNGSKRTTKASI